MSSRLVLVCVLALTVAAACAPAEPDSAGTTPAAGPDTATTTEPASTTGQGTAGAVTTTAPVSREDPVTRPEPDPNRPLAPDFSLVLADGATYTLSEEVRPVYLVFWAEW
jgi:hypothetical protein